MISSRSQRGQLIGCKIMSRAKTVKTVIQIDKQEFTGQSIRTLSEARGLHEKGYRLILICKPGSVLEKIPVRVR